MACKKNSHRFVLSSSLEGNFVSVIPNNWVIRIALSSLAVIAISVVMPIMESHDLYLPNAYAQQVTTRANNNTANSTFDSTAKDLSFKDLFATAKPSVVQITSIIYAPVSSPGFDNNTREAVALGSGFIIDKEGHIVTNHHVISNALNVTVTLSDGTIYNAKVIGSDAFSDIAVLDVQNVAKEKLVPLPLGNSSSLSVGEEVAAIGNPFGLTGSFSTGVVSGLGRLLPSQPPPDNNTKALNTNPAFSIPNVIQTDAVINPGNSGGPLLNLKGEVIGMNTAIFSLSPFPSFSGVGFAVPSDSIRTIVPALIMNGSYAHPWIGISGTDVTPEIATKLELKEAKGVLVLDISIDSPAEKAGIRGGDIPINIPGFASGQQVLELGGDIIVNVDGREVKKIDDLLSYIETEKRVGESVTLTVLRDGKMMNVDLVLAARPTR